MTIGITGGIGSGKTLISEMIRNTGFPVFDADKAARELLFGSEQIKKGLYEIFGESAFTNGQPDRKKIAEKVFASEILLNKLNSIIHPEVRAYFESWKNQQNKKFVFREAAILIESGSYKDCDKIILVQAPESIRLKRVMERDHVSEQDIRLRMKNQWREEDLIPYCHYFIVNDDRHPLVPQVDKILQELIH